jgi:hypothetical protein
MGTRSALFGVALFVLGLTYPVNVSAGTVTNSVNTFDYQAAPGETNHLTIRGNLGMDTA